MKRLLLNWMPVIICGLIIFYLSSRPIRSPVEVKYLDLIGHAIFYAIFAFLVARALILKQKAQKIRISVVLIILVSIYGVLIEWYQAYVPTRTASLADGIANTAGAFIGVMVYMMSHKMAKSKIKNQSTRFRVKEDR